MHPRRDSPPRPATCAARVFSLAAVLTASVLLFAVSEASVLRSHSDAALARTKEASPKLSLHRMPGAIPADSPLGRRLQAALRSRSAASATDSHSDPVARRRQPIALAQSYLRTSARQDDSDPDDDAGDSSDGDTADDSENDGDDDDKSLPDQVEDGIDDISDATGLSKGTIIVIAVIAVVVVVALLLFCICCCCCS